MPGSVMHRKGQDGFSLIETIVTLVILAIAAVGILTVFSTAMKGAADPLVLGQAIQLAQGELDEIAGEKEAFGFNAATLAAGSRSCRSTMLAGFSCSRTICFVPSADWNSTAACTTPTNYKHVTVTITQASLGTIGLDTLLANY